MRRMLFLCVAVLLVGCDSVTEPQGQIPTSRPSRGIGLSTPVASSATDINERGQIIGRPRIIGRAIASEEVFQNLVPSAEDVVRSVLNETKSGTSISDVEKKVQKTLSDYFYKKTKNRPEIIVTSIPA